MEIFALIAVVLFLLYLQASVYAFWNAPDIGTNLWVSLTTLLFSIWYLSYVFSTLGRAGVLLFPLDKVSIFGLLLLPAFIARTIFSLQNIPGKLVLRNIYFLALLTFGLLAYYFFIVVAPFSHRITQDIWFINDPVGLIILHSLLLPLNAYLFTRMQFGNLQPERISPDIIEHSNCLVMLCDTSFRVISMNEIVLLSLGVGREKIKGTNFWKLLKNGSNIEQSIKSSLLLDEKVSFESQVSITANRELPVLIDIYRLHDIYNDMHGYVVTGVLTEEVETLRSGLSGCENRLFSVKEKLGGVFAGLTATNARLARIKRKHTRLISDYLKADEMLLAGLQEKEQLLVEVHERVVSNMKLMLGLVDLYQSQDHSEHIQERLRKLSQRIYALLMVHQHLSVSLHHSVVDFKTLVRDLSDDLASRYDPAGLVSIDLHLDDVFLDISKAIPMGLILNELLANCYQHAFGNLPKEGMAEPRQIGISLSFDLARCVLDVWDNGCGISSQEELISRMSGGLALVHLLVRDQLEGDAELTRGQGTSWKIVFPLWQAYAFNT